MRDTQTTQEDDVVLGEDWVTPDAANREMRVRRERRGLLTLNRSPLARKIITFNLIGLLVLIAGILYLNPFRDTLGIQRRAALETQAQLIADAFSLSMPGGLSLLSDSDSAATTLRRLSLPPGTEVFLFDTSRRLLAHQRGPDSYMVDAGSRTVFIDALNSAWDRISQWFGQPGASDGSLPTDADRLVQGLVPAAMEGTLTAETAYGPGGAPMFAVATPILSDSVPVGVIAVAMTSSEIDAMVRVEREQILQMFVVALLVSLGLSIVLASTIANPLADLASAAEIGADDNRRNVTNGRVRIPDLSGRPDEIGWLSSALRGMVAALYERIEANEQFASDVAHEIKNPLASLRSAVGTMRIAKREDQREKLLNVIEHDVRRLDRLVSDISNASRLDSELVKEEQERFDLMRMLGNLTSFLGEDAHGKGVEFVTDFPRGPIEIVGLEARLAQVFVNLITNAISFCEAGDAVRVWVRKRDNRVLVVVEDTGIGIPEQSLGKIFNRFYSERPAGQFGDHSGLGLAISKQIVDAHGGVIWAENIRPTAADATSDPLGARFVVGLPV